MLMNGTDRDYFDVKIGQIDRKLQTIHDDVLIIKTERKMEKRNIAVIAGAAALAVTTLINFFRG